VVLRAAEKTFCVGIGEGLPFPKFMVRFNSLTPLGPV